MVMDASDLALFAARFVTRVRIGGGPDAGAPPTAPLGIGDATDTSLSPAPSLHASMTLLRLPGRCVGVTCQHVVAAYRARRRRDSACAFRVGGVTLEPDERLLSEERFLDLAILDLEGLEGVEAGALSSEEHGVEFFEPPAWPLGSAEAGELVGLGGYGVTRVIDSGAENIACEVAALPTHAEYTPLDAAAGGAPAPRPPGDGASSEALADALAALGGLSGGPGFVRRGSGIHLAGVMFAVARSGAYLRLRPARFIRRDGTLLPRGSG